MRKLTLTKELAEQEISAVKRTNKTARERRAQLRGFASSELYLKALQAIVDGKVEVIGGKATKKKTASKTGEKPKILIIDNLDRSGSMGSSKVKDTRLYNSLVGLNEGIAKLKKEEAPLGVEYFHSFIYFDDRINSGDIKPISKVSKLSVDSGGTTALNDAILVSIDKALDFQKLNKNSKVLINIYTDGGENASRSNKIEVSTAITKAEEKGIVVTFIGIREDTKEAIRSYKIHDSNTMVYDGSAQGMSMSMQVTALARSTFSKKVVAGEDVKTGFYKKIIK